MTASSAGVSSLHALTLSDGETLRALAPAIHPFLSPSSLTSIPRTHALRLVSLLFHSLTHSLITHTELLQLRLLFHVKRMRALSH